MSTLSLPDSLLKDLMLTVKARLSSMSDDSTPDLECFEALPYDTFEAVGSSARVIRAFMTYHIKTIQVVKYLRFKNVPPSVAERDFSKSTRPMYNHETRSLILKIVDGSHEVAKATLNMALDLTLDEMGLPRSIYPTGSARVRGGSCSKEPDGSWVPGPHLLGRDKKWPSVVIEIGVSKSFQKLRADAAWWLANSMSQVNLVLLVSINQTSPEITFQTIVLDPESSAKRRYIPIVRQSVTASRAPKQPDTLITSPEEPLIIKFEGMFCRLPTAPESDIQISLHWLERISRNVWMQQKL